MITPWSTEITVNETITGTQTNPHTATLDNGNFVVVWEDSSTDTIHYRIFDTTGAPVTGEMTVDNSGAQPDGSLPNVIPYNGGFIIAHQSFNPAGGVYSQTLTIYNAAGVEVGEQLVEVAISETSAQVELVELAGGGIAVITKDTTAGVIDVEIFDATLTSVASSSITTGTSSSTTHPSAVQLTNNEIAIVWEQGSVTGWVVMNELAIIQHQGTVGGDTWGVPKVIAGPEGTFVVGFNDWEGAFPADSVDPQTYLLANDGTIIVDETFLASTFDNEQIGIEITALSDGSGYLGIWFDETSDTFMARAFDWFGNPVGPQTPFAADQAGNYSSGSILEQISATVLDDGRIAISYQTGGLDGDSAGVGLTIIDPRQGNIFGTTASETLYGSSQSDIIMSSSGDDVVFGGAGNDYIYDALASSSADAEFYGEAGDDLLVGGAGFDYLDGGRGDDTLYGGSAVDELYGGNDDDILYGGAGDDEFMRGNNGSDVLDGGAGRDFLGGGPAADEFKFSNYLDSVAGGLRDRILDFQQGVDTINVELIDADINTGADDAFVFIGTANFSNTAGEMRFLTTSNKTIVQMDIDGDGVADSSFELTGVYTLTDTDFIL